MKIVYVGQRRPAAPSLDRPAARLQPLVNAEGGIRRSRDGYCWWCHPGLEDNVFADPAGFVRIGNSARGIDRKIFPNYCPNCGKHLHFQREMETSNFVSFAVQLPKPLVQELLASRRKDFDDEGEFMSTVGASFEVRQKLEALFRGLHKGNAQVVEDNQKLLEEVERLRKTLAEYKKPKRRSKK